MSSFLPPIWKLFHCQVFQIEGIQRNKWICNIPLSSLFSTNRWMHPKEWANLKQPCTRQLTQRDQFFRQAYFCKKTSAKRCYHVTCYHLASEGFVLLCPSNPSLPLKYLIGRPPKLNVLDSPVRTLTILASQSLGILSDTKYCFKYDPDFVKSLGLFTR